jgi:hypothetical protein
MPFLESRTDFLPAYRDPSLGPTTGFTENFGATFTAQSYRESYLGHADLLQQEFERTADEVERLTGKRPEVDFAPSVYSMRARELENLGIERPGSAYHVEALKKLKDFDAQLAEMKKTNPQVRTTAEMWDAAKKRAKEVGYEEYSVSSRASALGRLGQFGGGMAGSFTTNDPLNLFTLGAGGVGRNAVTRVLTEMGAAGAIESVNQFTGVATNKTLLGIENTAGQKLENIFFAAAGAGVFRGVAEGAPTAYRALEARVAPQRAFARVLRDTVDSVPLSRFTDPTRAAYEALKRFETSEARAARWAYERGIDIEKINPFGPTREGAQFFEEQGREFERRLLEQDLKASTAIGRVLPGEKQPAVAVSDFDLVAAKEIETEARARAPEIFRQLDEANAKLAELDNDMRAIRQDMEVRGVGDALELLDPATGARVREIEAELGEAIPRRRREELERELDTITANFDPEAVAKAENDFRIGPKNRIRSIEASRRAARRNFRKAQRAAEQVVNDIASRKAAERRLRIETEAVRQRGEIRRTLDSGQPDIPTRRQPVADVAAAVREAVELAEKVPADERAAAAMKAAKPDEEGKVDLGFGPIPENFRVAIDVAKGADGDEAVTKTVRELLDDADEDDKLLEQMTKCSLS